MMSRYGDLIRRDASLSYAPEALLSVGAAALVLCLWRVFCTLHFAE